MTTMDSLFTDAELDPGLAGTPPGWRLEGWVGQRVTPRCQASVMSSTGGPCTHRWWPDPVGHMRYRGRCLGCDWSSANIHDAENGAAEDALDHAWPGWRLHPVVDPPSRYEPASLPDRQARWAKILGRYYPAGWLEAGGPIRTRRDGAGYRSVPQATPWSGYDAASNWQDLVGRGQ